MVEVPEARRTVEQLSRELHRRGCSAVVFHDNTSTTVGQNLNRIVNWHNSQKRQLDISVHFNAFQPTEGPRGTEVCYLTQASLAGEVSAAIASAGFIDRGAKKRTDLKFLNATSMPAILLEICFVDSHVDADIYRAKFNIICSNIANVLGGKFPTEAPSDAMA